MRAFALCALIGAAGCLLRSESPRDTDRPGDRNGDATASGDTLVGDAFVGDPSAGDAMAAGDPFWQAPTHTVFFSVGQNTDDHKTGTPTVTVVDGVATFSEPQTAANMGVGDVIYYGSSKCMISSKVSARVWRCTSVTGRFPNPVTDAPVTRIAHVFDSLAAAFAEASDGNHLGTNDLQAAGISLGLACYNDSGGADTTQAILTGYVTGPSNQIRIFTPTDTATECNQSQRHAGVWDDSKYRLVVIDMPFNQAALWLRVPYTTVDGLQIDVTGDSNIDGIGTTNAPQGYYFYSNNIIVGHPGGASQNSDGICVHSGDSGQVVHAWNNLIMGFNVGSTQASGIYASVSGIEVVAHNNTIVDCDYGIYQGSGQVAARNNIVEANVTGFTGSYDGMSDYNISNQADAPGPHSQSSVTVQFVGGGDYHLSTSDGVARNHGSDLSDDAVLRFDTDIDGELRTGLWDIGADEVQ